MEGSGRWKCGGGDFDTCEAGDSLAFGGSFGVLGRVEVSDFELLGQFTFTHGLNAVSTKPNNC